jgi:hypothetical protein
MTAPLRAPPSLGGKRHAAMAGSHPPLPKHWEGLRHVKVTDWSAPSGRLVLDAYTPDMTVFLCDSRSVPPLRFWRSHDDRLLARCSTLRVHGLLPEIGQMLTQCLEALPRIIALPRQPVRHRP